MSLRRLIITLIAAMALLMPAKLSAAEAAPSCTLESIDQTGDRPQWQDIGICDVLAVTGGSSVTPPTTVRVVHDSPSGISATTQGIQARHYGSLHLASHNFHRTVCGYIYLIHCLRL